MNTDETFPPKYRLKTREDFACVYRLRRSVSDGYLIMYGRRNEKQLTRLGLSVSRKIGNAVVRNRWKRIIRDVFRRCREELPPGLDLILLPKQGQTPDSERIAKSLPALVHRVVRRIDQPARRNVRSRKK